MKLYGALVSAYLDAYFLVRAIAEEWGQAIDRAMDAFGDDDDETEGLT